MAEQSTTISAPFPAPPPFYKHFTLRNVSQLRGLRKEAATSTGDGEPRPTLDTLSLPPELRYLLPPRIPADNTYRTFGGHVNLEASDATLQDAGIEQLYASDPSVILHPQAHLIALTRSLLTTFLSLLGVLSQDPTAHYQELVDSLQTIMYNTHDLINKYRPHQARESLMLMMEERIDALKEEVRRVREAKADVGQIVDGMIQAGQAQNVERSGCMPSAIGDGDDKRMGGGVTTDMAKQRSAWATMGKSMPVPI